MPKCQHVGVYSVNSCPNDATHTLQFFVEPDNVDEQMGERWLCRDHALSWKHEIEWFGGIADITEGIDAN